MNNQNNPYPDIGNQPLLGNQHHPNYQQQPNQGYVPPHQHYPRIYALIQHPHLLLPSTTRAITRTPMVEIK